MTIKERVQPSTATHKKLEALKSILREMDSVIVAYSGGVDSAFLAVTASDVLESRSLAITATSPSLAPSELRDAVSLASQLGIRHRVIETREIERPEYQDNTPNRCYFCKDELYTHLTHIAKEEGFAWVANGANIDDLGDFRPGLKAAKEHGARSPLVEAGLTKADIRVLSKRAGLPTWDKPAQACLSSRIPYGTPVTVDALERIAKGEEFLRSLGIKQLRVRHHDTIARIELEPQDFHKVLNDDVRSRIIEHFRSIGYAYVTLDLTGFRSGSLNEVLTSFKQSE